MVSGRATPVTPIGPRTCQWAETTAMAAGRASPTSRSPKRRSAAAYGPRSSAAVGAPWETKRTGWRLIARLRPLARRGRAARLRRRAPMARPAGAKIRISSPAQAASAPGTTR